MTYAPPARRHDGRLHAVESTSARGSVIAYLILVHRFPEQFKRLFRAIYAPGNAYVVHVDARSGPDLEQDIRTFLVPYLGAELLPSRPAQWGGYSLVEAELRGMSRLLEMNADWVHFINLSGQDFPLRSQSAIRALLGRNRGREFIRVADQALTRPETMARVGQISIEHPDRMERTGQDRPFLDGVRPYIGNQWMIVSRRFCQFACHDARAERFKAFYRNTFIADEGFFQTLMMSTDEHGPITGDDLRAIDWVPDGDIKLRPRTYTMDDATALLASEALFARKFDSEVDDDILDLLEDALAPSGIAARPSATRVLMRSHAALNAGAGG